MTLSERCKKHNEEIECEKCRKANRYDYVIDKFKDAFYNYDWEKLDSNYILRYQEQTIFHRSHVFLIMGFLKEILKLANLKESFVNDKKFLNALAEQKILYLIYKPGANIPREREIYSDYAADRCYIKIFLDEYEENKKTYIRSKEKEVALKSIEDDINSIEAEFEDSDEPTKNLRRITRHRTAKEAELYRKTVWNNFYNNDRIIMRLHVHNLMEDPNDIPVSRYGVPVILFVFSIPNNEDIITLSGWYDNEHDMWKRSGDDSPIGKDRICGWADFQRYENVTDQTV